MARATLTIVKREVYDSLGITNVGSGYGNLKTNQRWLTGYIDDQIAFADIWLAKLLFTNKQEALMAENYATQVVTSGTTINNNYGIVKVEYDTNGSGSYSRAEEIDFDLYERLSEGGIFSTATYTGYYAIQDNQLYGITNHANFRLTYIDFTHPSSLSALKCPAGFESVVAKLASALLLMKRNDNPTQAKFYMDSVREFMQQYMIPENNFPQIVDN